MTPGAKVRVAGPGDAAALLRLKRRLDQETAFMLLEPDERDTSVQALAHEMGFSVEGRRVQCLVIDGQFVDELYMAAILGGPGTAQGRQ